MSTPWYDFGVTQAFGQNGEQGVDIGTPFHTPITNLYGGQVVEAQYGGAGGIVGILTNVPGLGKVVEYFLHLDLINVSVGQQIGVGQMVGLSGGETPAQAPALGGLHPAQPQFSTGPHTEFGFFSGTPFASQNEGNPLPYLKPGTGNAPTPTNGASSGNGCPTMQWYDWLNPEKVSVWSACQAANKTGQINQGINALENPIGTLFGFLFQGLATSLENVGFFILALVLLIAGFVLIAYEPLKQGAGDAVKGAFVA